MTTRPSRHAMPIDDIAFQSFNFIHILFYKNRLVVPMERIPNDEEYLVLMHLEKQYVKPILRQDVRDPDLLLLKNVLSLLCYEYIATRFPKFIATNEDAFGRKTLIKYLASMVRLLCDEFLGLRWQRYGSWHNPYWGVVQTVSGFYQWYTMFVMNSARRIDISSIVEKDNVRPILQSIGLLDEWKRGLARRPRCIADMYDFGEKEAISVFQDDHEDGLYVQLIFAPHEWSADKRHESYMASKDKQVEHHALAQSIWSKDIDQDRDHSLSLFEGLTLLST